MRKPFDSQLFSENDARARETVAQFLHATNECTVEENPDIYGVDLIVTGVLGNQWAVEVEIKRVWSGPDFPWATVQLPERKRKYLEQGLPVEYWLLNFDCTSAIVIPGELLDEYPPVEVPNKYVANGERFFQIPVKRCRRVAI